MILTTLPTWKPLFKCETLTSAWPDVVIIGSASSFLFGSDALWNTAVAKLFLNAVLYILKVKSAFCDAVKVTPFWEKNKLPSVGCLAILLAVDPKTN